MTRHGRILTQLGGRTCLATVLRLPPETVKSWYKRGIPAAYWHRIGALAPEWTPEKLARTRPLKRRRKANGHKAAAGAGE